MTTTSKAKDKLRVEIWLTRSESRKIKTYVCKEGESRKEAIERMIQETTAKAYNRQQKLIA